MTLSPFELLLYAGAVAVLFLTPGPVWVALVARALSGGFQSAWPLALGVVVGDAIWPFLAILGVSWVASSLDGVMTVLRYVAVAMFLFMGIIAIRHADRSISTDSRLTRPGKWTGFLAGVAVILSNPKAILFYMGLLPGFFDLTHVTGYDIAAIVIVSMLVPLAGNLMMAILIGRIRGFLTTTGSRRLMNISAGILLILVGLIIPFV